MNRILEAAAVVAQLTAKVGAEIVTGLEPELATRLADALGLFPSFEGDFRKGAVLAFAIALQARAHQAAPTLNARGLANLVQAHPVEARALLGEWLTESNNRSQPSVTGQWTPLEKVLIFLQSLDDDVSARVACELDPDVHRALLETDLGKLPEGSLAAVLPELEQALNLRWTSLAETAMREPGALAIRINDWIMRSDEEDLPRPAAIPDPSARIRAVAILLMSLTPEVSAQIFKELSPEMVQGITRAISDLPRLNRDFREAVVLDFQRAFGLGSGGSEELEETARRAPAAIASYLLQWIGNGFLMVCGSDLLPYAGSPAVSRSLEALVHELEACWLRELPVPTVVSSGKPGYEVSFCWNDKPVATTMIHPNKALIFEPEPTWVSKERAAVVRAHEGRVESSLDVLRRCLGTALAELDEEPPEERDLPLSTDGVAAMAVLRAFHPNLLSHELGELKSDGLSSVASGLIELLTISTESLSECLRLSVNFSPGELLEQAKLVTRGQQYGGAQKVAILLYLLPNPKAVLTELFRSLTAPQAVLVTEKLARLVFRREDRAMSPREELAALGEFADWRAAATRPPGIPSFGQNIYKLVKTIPQVWPRPRPEQIRETFMVLAREQPHKLSVMLAQYLRQRAALPWIPGPLRAAHFLNGLGDADQIRQHLAEQGYPLPRVALNLEQTREARKEWALRARTLTMN